MYLGVDLVTLISKYDLNKMKMFYNGNRPDYVCYVNDKGQMHREDGPAYEYKDGTKTFWIHGVALTKEQFIHWRL